MKKYYLLQVIWDKEKGKNVFRNPQKFEFDEKHSMYELRTVAEENCNYIISTVGECDKIKLEDFLSFQEVDLLQKAGIGLYSTPCQMPSDFLESNDNNCWIKFPPGDCYLVLNSDGFDLTVFYSEFIKLFDVINQCKSFNYIKNKIERIINDGLISFQKFLGLVDTNRDLLAPFFYFEMFDINVKSDYEKAKDQKVGKDGDTLGLMRIMDFTGFEEEKQIIMNNYRKTSNLYGFFANRTITQLKNKEYLSLFIWFLLKFSLLEIQEYDNKFLTSFENSKKTPESSASFLQQQSAQLLDLFPIELSNSPQLIQSQVTNIKRVAKIRESVKNEDDIMLQMDLGINYYNEQINMIKKWFPILFALMNSSLLSHTCKTNIQVIIENSREISTHIQKEYNKYKEKYPNLVKDFKFSLEEIPLHCIADEWLKENYPHENLKLSFSSNQLNYLYNKLLGGSYIEDSTDIRDFAALLIGKYDGKRIGPRHLKWCGSQVSLSIFIGMLRKEMSWEQSCKLFILNDGDYADDKWKSIASQYKRYVNHSARKPEPIVEITKNVLAMAKDNNDGVSENKTDE